MTPKTVLDLGTGTGLLALASASLGAERILAVDLNMLAAQTAQNNVRLNKRENNLLIAQGKAETFIHYPVDLLIANIHFDVMRQLINTRTFLDNKAFILSGLMRREAKEVVNILARMPVKVLKTWAAEGTWHTFLGKRL
jgi:ribosomal protein L11 methyltransferase